MTAKEAAKRIRGSPSTDSMVINNRPGISPARREQVLAKMGINLKTEAGVQLVQRQRPGRVFEPVLERQAA